MGVKETSWMKYAGFVAAAALLPFLLQGRASYFISLLTLAGVYAILVLGLNMLMGLAGQICLGHAAFYGIGAYSSAVLAVRLGWSPWLSLPLAAALTGVIAFLVGLPILKLRGHYLALATLGMGIAANKVMVAWQGLTGGPDGITDIPPFAVGRFVFNTDMREYWLVWAVVFFTLLLGENIIGSDMGRALRAIKEDETAANALGLDTALAKTKVFVLSAVLASIAGVLYAHCQGFISPESFDFFLSVKLVVMVAVGGMLTVWGALLGALILTLLPEFLTLAAAHWHGVDTVEIEIMLYGLVLVLLMIFAPNGLAGKLKRWVANFQRRFGSVYP